LFGVRAVGPQEERGVTHDLNVVYARHEEGSGYEPTFGRLACWSHAAGALPLLPEPPAWAPEVERGLVGFQLYCGQRQRDWPAEHWAALYSLLRAASVTVRVFLAPGQERPPWAQDVSTAASWSELCSQVGKVAVMVTPDGGLMHVAALMGRPSVSVFGPTSGVLLHGLYPGRALQGECDRAPCYFGPRFCGAKGIPACMDSVSPADVAQAAMEVLCG